jgi:hypothetical protein
MATPWGRGPLIFAARSTFNGVSIRYWILQLDDKDPNRRRQAVYALSRFGPFAKAAIPDLIRASEKPELQGEPAARALTAIGKEALPALIKALSEKNEKRRITIALAISYFAMFSPVDESIPALVEALNDPSKRVRMEVATTLGRMGPRAKVAVAALVECLSTWGVERQPPGAAPVVHALSKIVEPLYTRDAVRDLSQSELEQLHSQLGRARKAMVHALKFEQKVLETGETVDFPFVFNGNGLEDPRVGLQRVYQILEDELRERSSAKQVSESARRTHTAFAIAGVSLLLSLCALAVFTSPRGRRWLLILRGYRWVFAAGSCDHKVVIGYVPGDDQVRIAVDADGESAEGGFAIASNGTWPPDSEQLRELRGVVRGKRVRIAVVESQFRKPWAITIGGPLSEWCEAAIAGQICLLNELVRVTRLQVKYITFAGLGCVLPLDDLLPRDLPKLGRLEGTKEEIDQVTLRFSRWGASLLNLPASAREEATIGDLSRALTEADIVHVSAHASPQGVFLQDGLMDGSKLRALFDKLRCRLLILSACYLGELRDVESFVFPLVRRGVNVLAATQPLLNQASQLFFRSFYRELLPARKAEGVELAQALRQAAAECFPSRGKGIRGMLWAPGINSFILYGDPSLQLRLRPHERKMGT